MDSIAEYIISVTSAAVLCGCICSFFEKKGTISSVLKLLSGIFLAMIALHPVMDIQIPDLALFDTFIVEDGEALAEQAKSQAAQEQRQYISNCCQTYIAQKANSLGCDLEISITTCSEPPFSPNGVLLAGNISPQAKSQLSQWIQDNFDIKPEALTWLG